MLVLLPADPSRQGEFKVLAGHTTVEFSDRVVDLRETEWAEPSAARNPEDFVVSARDTESPLALNATQYALDPEPGLDWNDATKPLNGSAGVLPSGSKSISYSSSSSSIDFGLGPAAGFRDETAQAIQIGASPVVEQFSLLPQSALPISLPQVATPMSQRPSLGISDIVVPLIAAPQASDSVSSVPAEPLVEDTTPFELYGTRANDVLRGGPENDLFYTSRGEDVFLGAAGFDTVVGLAREGAVAYQISSGSFRVLGEMLSYELGADGIVQVLAAQQGSFIVSGVEWFRENESAKGFALSAIAMPSVYADTIDRSDSNAAVVINALSGNDAITGSRFGDQLFGGLGNDTLDGGLNTELTEGRFFESLSGGDGNDSLRYRGFQADTADASELKAILLGEAGNDWLHVFLDQATDVQVSGGVGLDRLVLTSEPQAGSIWSSKFMNWALEPGANGYLLAGSYVNPLVTGAGLYELDPTIEQVLVGSETSVRLSLARPSVEDSQMVQGSAGSDLLVTVSGQPTRIVAGAGDDVVIAGPLDTVVLGQGINQVFSASADYTVSYAQAAAGVSLNLITKLGLIFDETAGLLGLDRFELAPSAAIGSSHSDTFIVGGADVGLTGGGGADRFYVSADSAQGLVSISDLSLEQGDKLFLNVRGLEELFDGPFRQISMTDAAGVELFSKDFYAEGEAVLRLLLSQQEGTVAYEHNGQAVNIVQADFAFEGLTPEQIATLVTIDYS